VQLQPIQDFDEELEARRLEENLPLTVQERRQTIKVFEIFKEKAKWGEFYRVYGMVLLALGGYFLTVPFYNVICQHFGFNLYTGHRDYRRADNEINVFRKFLVCFMAHAEDEIPWQF
jgi:cytochrome c oxidase assembly protein Cox11